jgi:hypothetical protein
MQQVEQEEKQYVLVPVSTNRYASKKLHFVIGEKQKKEAVVMHSRPAHSLCGIEASRFSDNFVDYTEPEDFFEELKADYHYNPKQRIKRRYLWDVRTNREVPKDDPYYASHRDEFVRDVKDGYLTFREEPRTLDDVRAEMWCKTCQKKKAEAYPDL